MNTYQIFLLSNGIHVFDFNSNSHLTISLFNEYSADINLITPTNNLFNATGIWINGFGNRTNSYRPQVLDLRN